MSIQKTLEVLVFGFWKALRHSDLLIDKENNSSPCFMSKVLKNSF